MSLLTRTATAATPKDPAPTTPLRQILGHVAMTERTGCAWYRADPVSWSFRPDRDRESHMVNQAVVMAQLTGQKMRIRGTTTPFPVRTWAEQHHNLVVEKGRPYGAGPLPYWGEFLAGEQQLFLDEHQSEKEVFFGVDFLQRGMLADYFAGAAKLFAPSKVAPLTRELHRQQAALGALDTLMSRAGMHARPLTPAEMHWLLHRSSHLGFPAPARRLAVDVDEWAAGDLADLLDTVSWTAEPFAATLKVTGILNGRTITRHVAVLTVGRMQRMDIPQKDQPWMTIPDSLGIPLEWSAHITPRADKDVLSEIRLILGKISSQKNHYELEHGVDAPSALEDQRAQALQVEQELSNIADASLGRAKGWWRVAVSGRTKQECLGHVERVIAAYGRKVEIKHTFGQYDLASEFMPGSIVKHKAHMRKLPLRAVAAGGAAVTSMAGDRRGWNIGRAAQDNSPVMFDFWRNMETYDVSGLFPVTGGLGSGKSTLVGGVVGKTGLSGVHWCVIDPTGRLSRLGRTPQLHKVSRIVDLLNGAPGSMNPYAMVREPKLEDFDYINLAELDDTEATAIGLRVDDLYTAKISDLDPERVEALRQRRFAKARSRAVAVRTRLCLDSVLQMLPATFVVSGENAGHVATELRLAAQAIVDPRGKWSGRPNKHPGMVIEALRESQTNNRSVAIATADMLTSLSNEPQPSLLFPTSDDEAGFDDSFDAQLIFLSTKGIVMPDPDTKPEYWQDEPRQGVGILNLASWKALRWVYGLPAGQRKGIALDEVQFLNSVSSGRLMITESGRNSRKQNLLVLAAGQDPGDALLDQRGGNNFIGGAFIGRMDDAEAAGRALRMAQVPIGVGYENTLLDMPKPTDEFPDVPRRFLFYNRGGAGFKEIITVTRAGEHTDWMWEALESAPGQEYVGAAA